MLRFAFWLRDLDDNILLGCEHLSLWAPGVSAGLAVLAIAQLEVHLVFFLHVTIGPDNTNNILALAFGVLIVFLVLMGSVVIKANLNKNMMSDTELMNLHLADHQIIRRAKGIFSGQFGAAHIVGERIRIKTSLFPALFLGTLARLKPEVVPISARLAARGDRRRESVYCTLANRQMQPPEKLHFIYDARCYLRP